MELNLKALSYSRHNRPVLDRVSGIIPGTGLTCLLGTNGAGKTTLLRILCGDLKPISGTFVIGNVDAASLAQKEISSFFSIIPQKSPTPENLTVSEMVALGRFRPEKALLWRLSNDDRQKISAALNRCGLGKFAGRKVAELSGGEQQRVWLAFGLASEKAFLIFDETLEGLDFFAKQAFYRLLKEISGQDRGIILSTHDLNMVNEYADKIIVLSQGRVAYEGGATADLPRYLLNPGENPA